MPQQLNLPPAADMSEAEADAFLTRVGAKYRKLAAANALLRDRLAVARRVLNEPAVAAQLRSNNESPDQVYQYRYRAAIQRETANRQLLEEIKSKLGPYAAAAGTNSAAVMQREGMSLGGLGIALVVAITALVAGGATVGTAYLLGYFDEAATKTTVLADQTHADAIATLRDAALQSGADANVVNKAVSDANIAYAEGKRAMYAAGKGAGSGLPWTWLLIGLGAAYVAWRGWPKAKAAGSSVNLFFGRRRARKQAKKDLAAHRAAERARLAGEMRELENLSLDDFMGDTPAAPSRPSTPAPSSSPPAPSSSSSSGSTDQLALALEDAGQEF